jgi:F0F1-type ATP synthase delta subunit
MPGEEDLVKEAIKDSILTLSYDINGTHVIQKVISSIDENNREHINKTLLNNIDKLIYDSNGICVVTIYNLD